MFIFGFFVGFLACFIFFLVAYAVIKEIIFKYGKTIIKETEDTLNKMGEHVMDKTTIIYPNYTEEAFKDGDLKLDEILK